MALCTCGVQTILLRDIHVKGGYGGGDDEFGGDSEDSIPRAVIEAQQGQDPDAEEPETRAPAEKDPTRIDHEFYDPRDFYDDDNMILDEADFADDDGDKAYEVKQKESQVLP